MEHRVSYTVIGAFVLILGGMLVAGLLWLAAGGATTRYQNYVLYLRSGAASLNRDSPVLYHGVPVGRVESVSLDPKKPTRARIILGIHEGTPIKVDTEAVVETRGVTGSGFVDLTGGEPSSPPLKARAGEQYPVIPAKHAGVASLTSEAQAVAERITKISDRLDEVLSSKNIAALSDSLQNIRVVTANLAQQSKRLGSVISNLDGTLANVRDASNRLPGMMDQVQKTIADVQRVAKKVGNAADGIDKSASSVRQLTPEAANLLQRLAQASESLDALLQQIERRPSVLILGRHPRPGPGEQGAGGSGG